MLTAQIQTQALSYQKKKEEINYSYLRVEKKQTFRNITSDTGYGLALLLA